MKVKSWILSKEMHAYTQNTPNTINLIKMNLNFNNNASAWFWKLKNKNPVHI